MAGPTSDPNGNWFYNAHTGQIQHITNYFERLIFLGESYEIPFATKADAEAYKKEFPPTHKSVFDPTDPQNPIFGPPAGTPKKDIPAYNGDPGGLTGVIGGAIQKATGLSGLEKEFGVLAGGITDGKMWRSFGWLLLGLLILVIGVALWVQGSVNPLAALRRK